MSKIAVIGLVGESVFMTVDRHQAVGETAHATSIHREWGGKGYNQAVAAARFGAEVSFLGAVSASDVEAVSAAAASDGITPVLIPKSEATAYAAIVTDKTGDNRVTVFGGAKLTATDVEAFRENIESADILLLNNEVPEEVNLLAAEIAASASTRIIINPAPARKISDRLVRAAELLTPNEHEASAIAEKEKLIVTLGGDGCLISSLGITVPIYDVGTPTDTTGAGDTFSGTLAVALAEDCDLLTSCRIASAASAIEVTRRYVMPAIPKREETLALYRKIYGNS